MAAGISRIAVRHRVDRVIVVLGVGGIDGHEGNLAPVLATGEVGGGCRFGFGEHRAGKYVGNAVGLDGDQAHGALGLERPEPLPDPRGLEPVTGGSRHLRGDQIAVLRVRGRAGRNAQLFSDLLFLYRGEPPAAAREGSKNSEHPMLGALDDLDDAALVPNLLPGVLDFLGTQQRPVADAGDLPGSGAARNMNPNFRGRPVGLLVPFRRDCNQLAIAVACDDVGENHGGQFAGAMQLLAPALEVALVGELAKHVLELDALVPGNPELTSNLALADLAGTRCDEGQKLRFAGKPAGFRFLAELFGQRMCQARGSISGLSAPQSLSALYFWRGGCGAQRSRFAGPARLLRARFPGAPHRALRAGVAGLGVDQRHRILETDRLRSLVGWQRRVHAVVADVGPVAAMFGNHGAALDGMLAERSSGIRAEPATPPAFELLFRDQGHGAVEADVEDLIPGLETRVGLAVLHVRTEPAEPGEDRFARLRMKADFARQAEERAVRLEN